MKNKALSSRQSSPDSRHKINIAILALGCLIAGYFSNPLLARLSAGSFSSMTSATSTPALRESDPEYALIKPLLLCSERSETSEYAPFKQKIAAYVDSKIKDKSAIDVSVYFKNLSSGQWAGINADDHYSPASLLKVPVMLAYFKMAETDPKILTSGVLFDTAENQNLNEFYAPKTTLKQGSTYLFSDLIRMMIQQSDNNAVVILQKYLEPEAIRDVYATLGLPLHADNPTDDFISVRSYSYFFRILYNATYLNREYSEKALAILSGADFSEGLVAGVPEGTTVAHKFGERTVLDSAGNAAYRELHDCGIVYGAKDPYAICVMTKGSDFGKLSSIISTISGMAYSQMSAGK